MIYGRTSLLSFENGLFIPWQGRFYLERHPPQPFSRARARGLFIVERARGVSLPLTLSPTAHTPVTSYPPTCRRRAISPCVAIVVAVCVDVTSSSVYIQQHTDMTTVGTYNYHLVTEIIDQLPWLVRDDKRRDRTLVYNLPGSSRRSRKIISVLHVKWSAD